MKTNINSIDVSLNQLLLDPNNYRLDHEAETKQYTDSEIDNQTTQEETQEKLERQKLGELRESILENGFLEMDRIVVRRLTDSPLKYVVIEGNRRAAAFKGLISDHREGVRTLPDSLIETAKSINVVCIEGEKEDVDRYAAALMGIRHVSGPKRWSGFQSARLIYDLSKKGKTKTQIGSLLGISKIEAGRRLRGYHAYLQMKQDKSFENKCSNNHYALLLEFLATKQPGREWLGWEDSKNEFTNKNNRERLYTAITSPKGVRPEINNPTDARQFQKYLASTTHRKMIEDGKTLQELPPISQDSISRHKQMKDFLYLIENLDSIDISNSERSDLMAISSRIHELLK